MKLKSILACSVGLILSASGCSKHAEEDSADQLRVFRVKGIVIRVDDDGRTVVIQHEEIPGYMDAMTMPFRTKVPSESDNLSPGDEIEFTYKVAALSSWIESITKTGNQTDVQPPSTETSSTDKLLTVGETFPDFELINQDGQSVRLEDYLGSVVALTFIFTRCPVPEYCPAMMRNFKTVEDLLSASPHAPDKYQLLTVSFDSAYDTPEILNAYGKQFGQNSDNWNLLTSPDQKSIRSLGQSVGLMFNTSQKSIFAHNLRTVVLDRNAVITKIFTDETWQPEELASELILASQRE